MERGWQNISNTDNELHYVTMTFQNSNSFFILIQRDFCTGSKDLESPYFRLFGLWIWKQCYGLHFIIDFGIQKYILHHIIQKYISNYNL